jgi:predicted enzyme related to lactoylglutathione lyase
VKPRSIDFVSYNVSDMGRAEAFYRDVLGLDVAVPWSGEGNHFPEFEVDGRTISLTSLPQLPSGAIVALAVDDARAVAAELREKGVQIVLEPIETAVCFLGMIADPDGNQIVIHQRKDGTAG